MSAKTGHSKYRKWRLVKDHLARLDAKRQRVKGLQALLEMHEAAGNASECASIARRLRLAKQELRYMTQ